ncbi:glycosyltransferase [Dermabacteraceae bacterium TAE3-ERU27]|nr:glycosyltransferase [Dermabacteraceae bacterium TAE3-ERU27]
MKHILLVSPGFQGYYEGISAAIQSLGYRVTVHVYDKPRNISEKVKNKIAHELPSVIVPEFLIPKFTLGAVAAYRESRPDAVITIKGDRLSREWWDLLSVDNVPSITWLYDEIRRMDFSVDDFRSMGSICTYSSEDISLLGEMGISANHLPNAFDSLSKVTAHPQINALTFIGARYPNREKLLRQVQSLGCDVKVYGRQWSRNPMDILRTGEYRSSGLEAEGDVARCEAYGIMSSSLATLNMHYNQDGFTMRTFEACGVGGVQIVDREDVSHYYDPNSEVLVAKTAEQVAEALEILKKDRIKTDSLRAAAKRRTYAEHTLIHRMKALTSWL